MTDNNQTNNPGSTKDTKDTKEKDKEENNEKPVEKTPEEIQALLLADLISYAQLVDKTANTKEMRHIHRALRHTFARIRRKLTVPMLTKLILKTFPESLQNDKVELLNLLSTIVPSKPEPMELEQQQPSHETKEEEHKPLSISPEVEVYIRLLVVVFLIDNKHLSEAAKQVNFLIENWEHLIVVLWIL
jgi:hypothetical protein